MSAGAHFVLVLLPVCVCVYVYVRVFPACVWIIVRNHNGMSDQRVYVLNYSSDPFFEVCRRHVSDESVKKVSEGFTWVVRWQARRAHTHARVGSDTHWRFSVHAMVKIKGE